jgi:hypothetical protein
MQAQTWREGFFFGFLLVEYFIPLPLVDISWLRPSRASKFRVIAGPWKIRAQEVKVLCANTSQQRCEDRMRRSGRDMATDALLSSQVPLPPTGSTSTSRWIRQLELEQAQGLG